MDLLPTFGAPGLAIGLTGFLYFGTETGGKVKPLGWWWTLLLALVAGAAYNAAGVPFTYVSDFIQMLLGLFGEVVAKTTMAGIGLFLTGYILYKKLSTREVAVVGIVYFYVAQGSGGAFSVLADRIANLMNGLAG
ncbi:hypothetical protein [Streptomyces sp. H27-H5]|uniref:hypothetical protein n=1 Tax=Streptomyces sp. H27-H5 TaxID=2996460 RepID=UPI002270F0CD|nr:hypothetical protein [Streptomyces sp. H27-H5]MCY0957695.1 hypothetical protein [Streptomyces sp. H27-H5]